MDKQEIREVIVLVIVVVASCWLFKAIMACIVGAMESLRM